MTGQRPYRVDADGRILVDAEGRPVLEDAEPIASGRAAAGTRRVINRPMLDAVTAVAGPIGTAADAALSPDTYPMMGGAIGGAVGAAAGAPALGVGAVPASIAGATTGGAAGETLRQIVAELMGETPAEPLSAATQVVGQGLLQGGLQAGGAGIGKALEVGAPALMQSALKPTRTLLREYNITPEQLVQTLLKRGITVTTGGLNKLRELFDLTNEQIAALVKNAPGTVDKKAVASRVLTTANKIAQQTNPTKDLNAVGQTVDEWLDHPIYRGATLTTPEAQAAKVGTYRQIGKKYGEMGSAEIEAQKALARGLKEEVAANVPGVAELNAVDSEIMPAMDAVGQRLAVAGNRDPVGFAWAASQNPKAFLAALMDRNPAIKSFLAKGMYRAVAAVTGVAPQVIRAAVLAAGELPGEAPTAVPGVARRD